MPTFEASRPYVVGKVTGLRFFNISTDGKKLTLRGPFTECPWHLGEQTAICGNTLNVDAATAVGWDRGAIEQIKVDNLPNRLLATLQGNNPLRPHRAGSHCCNCGFWSYWNYRHATNFKDSSYAGMIDGWGLTSVAERGFRSEKARIIALAPNSASWSYHGAMLRLKNLVAQYPEEDRVPIYSDYREMEEAHPATAWSEINHLVF